MSSFYANVGRNIREVREIRGMTQAQLADAVSAALDDSISSKTVGAWERGTRRIFAEELRALAMALRCSESSLYGERGKKLPDARQRFNDAIALLSADEKEILQHAMLEWNGDTHALIHSVGLYMSLSEHDRHAVIWEMLSREEFAKQNGGLLPDAPPYDVDMIEKSWRRLLRK